MLRARPVPPDARLAVLAPASAPPDAERYRAGLAALRARGYRVEAPEHVPPFGYLAGPDAHRLDRLNEAIRRDDLDAILVARGGYGCHRLLPDIDYEAARANPKLLVGYSDLTALQCALLARAGVPSLSGPMVAPDWSVMDEATEASFRRAVSGEAPYAIENPDGEPLVTLRSGTAEGTLVAGNLAMFVALLGTPYLPSLGGALLVLEDIGEAPYKIDRMLAQLDLAGVLPRLGGLVFGRFRGCAPPPGRPSLSLADVLHTYADRVPGPVAAGLDYGHFRPQVSVPFGVPARLDASSEAPTLTVLESPVLPLS